ncbi:MAG TPA: type II secretion system F family protein [Verrucomicrobiae bacterium]|nr:type II secretion system F family protein [Verrucomicrobiae bacterium]
MIVTPSQLSRRAELYHQLGSMLAAGVPLIHSLEMANSHSALRGSRKHLLELVSHLNNGLTFSESMVAVHGWMPEFDVALLSAGERSGRLDISFKTLAGYYATRAQIIRDTLSRMIVTAATLHVFLVIFPLGLLIGFVQGILYDNYRQCLPFILEKIIVFVGLYTIAFASIYAGQAGRGEKWRASIEYLAQLVPFLRTARRNLVLARLSAALHSLISAGVSVVQSWQLAAAASGSPRLKREVSTWTHQLEAGATPAELVSRNSFFPQTFANLYQTGEISGQTDETLQRLQNYYQEEGFRVLQIFTRLLTGTVYGLVALLVAIFIIRFYIGYFATAFGAAGM